MPTKRALPSLWLSLLLALSTGAAQANPPAPAGSQIAIPCARALQRGLRGSINEYARSGGDRSESAHDLIAEHYAGCLRQRMQPQVAALPASQQASLQAIGAALESWKEAYHDVHHHGTSLATHLTLRAAVPRAELEERLLVAWRGATPGDATRHAQQADLQAALKRQALQARAAQAPDPESRADFAEALQRFTRALDALDQALRVAPPQGLPLITAYLRRHQR